MSVGIVEKAYRASGIPQDDLSPNMPVLGKRRNRDWASIIGTIRKLEQQEHELQTESLRRIEKLSSDLADWMSRAHQAEREAEQLRLKLKILEGSFDTKQAEYLLGNGSQTGGGATEDAD